MGQKEKLTKAELLKSGVRRGKRRRKRRRRRRRRRRRERERRNVWLDEQI